MFATHWTARWCNIPVRHERRWTHASDARQSRIDKEVLRLPSRRRAWETSRHSRPQRGLLLRQDSRYDQAIHARRNSEMRKFTVAASISILQALFLGRFLIAVALALVEHGLRKVLRGAHSKELFAFGLWRRLRVGGRITRET